MAIRSAIAAVCSLALAGATHAAEAEPAQVHTVEEFLTTYRPALARLQAEYASFEAVATHVYRRPAAPPQWRTRRSTVRCYADWKRRSFQVMAERSVPVPGRAGPAQTEALVVSVSPHQSFQLGRAGNDSRYGIKRLGLGKEERNVLEVLSVHQYGFVFLAPIYAFAPMEDLIGGKHCRLLRVQSVTDHHRQPAVEVAFELDWDWYGEEHGLVRLRPDLGWAVSEWKTRTVTKFADNPDFASGETHCVIEYADGTYPPVPARVRQVVTEYPRRPGAEAVVVSEDQWEIDRFEFKPIPADRFTLRHFGLPDELLKPSGIGNALWRRTWLVLVGLLVVAALGWVSYRLMSSQPAH